MRVLINAKAYWFTNCAQKLNFPDSSPAASYVQWLALCSNCPANVQVSERVELVVRSY